MRSDSSSGAPSFNFLVTCALSGATKFADMSKSKADEKILSYNDVVLRRSDLDILSGPCFLNDRIIEFYFSYLTSYRSSENILLVPPSIAFWIKECPDTATLGEFLEPLYLSQRKLIMFPVNDNDDASVAEGGSHWSLLTFESTANVFVHYDSSSGNVNQHHARRLYKFVHSFVSSDSTYSEFPGTPKQVNGYDCGVYVLAFARSICCWYRSNESKGVNESCVLELEQITPSAVSKMRSEILELIRSLMESQ